MPSRVGSGAANEAADGVDLDGAVDVLEGKRDAVHLAAIVARHGIGFWTPCPPKA
jgi:hypothetical protein